MPKLLLVGWDGATFDVIKPLAEAGRMPNVLRLMGEGVWGRLDSSIPPLTPIAWTSISTGVNPGRHGIIDAIVYSAEGRRLSFVNSTLRKVKPLWSILSDQGRKVGIMNVPVTYPPEDVNGFAISGMFTPEGAPDIIYPASLKAELQERFGRYQIECKRHSDPARYLKAIIAEEIEDKEKISSYLMEREGPDFFFTAFLASDRVQHFFWAYGDPSHPEHRKYGDAIARVYESLDAALGRMLGKASADTYVMMVSDHGAGPLESAFFLNNWLIRKGYLKLLKDPKEAFSAGKASKIKSALIRRMKRLLPESLNSLIPGGDGKGRDELGAFLSIIDWEHTLAFSEGVAGGIFINNETVKPHERAGLLGRIAEELNEVRDPQGRAVVSEVHRREDIYSGDYVGLAPDLTVICSAGFQIIAPNEFFYYNRKFEDTLFLPHRWSGRHEQQGIFLLSGPGVRRGAEIKGCGVNDIAPTVLYLMGHGVPGYMDGKVLKEALLESYLDQNPIQITAWGEGMGGAEDGKELSEEEQDELTRRLQDLGYL